MWLGTHELACDEDGVDTRNVVHLRAQHGDWNEHYFNHDFFSNLRFCKKQNIDQWDGYFTICIDINKVHATLCLAKKRQCSRPVQTLQYEPKFDSCTHPIGVPL
jgi:hypothetical protein